MFLYYDNKNHSFSLEQTETSECVFQTYTGNSYDDRIGWKKGINPAIYKDNVKLVISTNFWPEKLVVNTSMLIFIYMRFISFLCLDYTIMGVLFFYSIR